MQVQACHGTSLENGHCHSLPFLRTPGASQRLIPAACFIPYPSRTASSPQLGGGRRQLRLPQVQSVRGRGGSAHALHHLDTVLRQRRQAQFCPLPDFERLKMLKSTEGELGTDNGRQQSGRRPPAPSEALQPLKEGQKCPLAVQGAQAPGESMIY